MAERKVKPEIMHLMILSKCNYKCELCCNKLYDIEKIPIATVKELKNNTHFVYYGRRTIHGKYRH